MLAGCQAGQAPSPDAGGQAKAEARLRWEARVRANTQPVIVSEGVRLLPSYAGALPYAATGKQSRAGTGSGQAALAMRQAVPSPTAL